MLNLYSELVAHATTQRINLFGTFLKDTIEYKSEHAGSLDGWLSPDDSSKVHWPMVIFIPGQDICATAHNFGEILLQAQLYSELGTDEVIVPYGAITECVLMCYWKPAQSDALVHFTLTEENLKLIKENASKERHAQEPIKVEI